jgi:hypothetical protein
LTWKPTFVSPRPHRSLKSSLRLSKQPLLTRLINPAYLRNPLQFYQSSKLITFKFKGNYPLICLSPPRTRSRLTHFRLLRRSTWKREKATFSTNYLKASQGLL